MLAWWAGLHAPRGGSECRLTSNHVRRVVSRGPTPTSQLPCLAVKGDRSVLRACCASRFLHALPGRPGHSPCQWRHCFQEFTQLSPSEPFPQCLRQPDKQSLAGPRSGPGAPSHQLPLPPGEPGEWAPSARSTASCSGGLFYRGCQVARCADAPRSPVQHHVVT